jgi:hypothetical protein
MKNNKRKRTIPLAVSFLESHVWTIMVKKIQGEEERALIISAKHTLQLQDKDSRLPFCVKPQLTYQTSTGKGEAEKYKYLEAQFVSMVKKEKHLRNSV